MGKRMHKIYKDAGYHKMEWNTPKSDSDLVGIYISEDGRFEVVVEHIEEGPSTLPEFKLSKMTLTAAPTIEDKNAQEWVFSGGVSVCCEDTARQYLELWGISSMGVLPPKSSRSEPRVEIPSITVDHWSE